MIVTRFAPSPTGRLHLGHAYSAAIGHDIARRGDGQFLLRIENLDPGRSRPEFVDGIFDDLHWLGLEWDGEPLIQSARANVYAGALDQLRDLGLVYPCFCTRSDIAAALSAPHEASPHYPGICRGQPDDPHRRATTPHSWRLNAGAAIARFGLPTWIEDDDLEFSSVRAQFDDVILARKDAPAAYHLACVVDDSASGVTLVVRGADLRPSTPVQRLLQTALGLPEPRYLHHPLVVHDNGRRLAKRDQAPTLQAMHDSGADGPSLAQALRAGLLPSGFRLADA